MSRKQYDLEFRPDEKRRSEHTLRLVLSFGAILLLAGVASVIALQRDGLMDQIFSSYLETTQEVTEAPEGAWDFTGSAVFLLAETDDAGQHLRFAALVRANMEQRRLTIIPLPPKAKAPLEQGGEITLEQALKAGGPKQLKAAVEALTQASVDRFLCSSDTYFVKAVNLMGSVNVQVEKRIRYRSGEFSLTLAEGAQRLQGDMLLRYFRYFGAKGDWKGQGELLRRTLETYLAPEAAAQLAPDAAWLEQRFGTLVNLMQTDISVTDFYANRELLLRLLTDKGETDFVVLEDSGGA